MERSEFEKLIIGDIIQNEFGLDRKENAAHIIDGFIVDKSNYGEICIAYYPSNGIEICGSKSIFYLDWERFSKSKEEFVLVTNTFLPENWESEYRFRWTDLEFAIDKKSIIQTSSIKEYNCIHCHDFNPWANSNLPNDKFMCFSCRDSNKWLYNEYLNGERKC